MTGWLLTGEYSILGFFWGVRLNASAQSSCRSYDDAGLLQPMLLQPSHDLHSSTRPGICHATRVRPFNNTPVHDRDQTRRPAGLKMVPVHLANDEKIVSRCHTTSLAKTRKFTRGARLNTTSSCDLKPIEFSPKSTNHPRNSLSTLVTHPYRIFLQSPSTEGATLDHLIETGESQFQDTQLA